MTKVIFSHEFEKDLKKLMKKYASLEKDMDLFVKVLRVVRENEIRGTVRIANLGENYKAYPVFKVKSFRCASLRGQGSKSGIRVIYYDNVHDDIITLLQIYHKSTTENHDEKRIKAYLDRISTGDNASIKNEPGYTQSGFEKRLGLK